MNVLRLLQEPPTLCMCHARMLHEQSSIGLASKCAVFIIHELGRAHMQTNASGVLELIIVPDRVNMLRETCGWAGARGCRVRQRRTRFLWLFVLTATCD